jgi:pyruvate kinase
MAAIQPTELRGLDQGVIKTALRETLFLRNKMIAAQERVEGMNLHPEHITSAKNLLAYLALRRHDIRPLQHTLSRLGLSSLGRCEAEALVALNRVIELLQRLSAEGDECPSKALMMRSETDDLLNLHAQTLFGGQLPERGTRIMVTLPSQAADDYEQVKGLIKAGMDCARINCAHDTVHDWARMIEHVRRASRTLGKHCAVLMDLAGPKLRTGMIDPAPAVLRLRPERDVFGRVMTPARVWLHAGGDIPAEEVQAIQLPRKWLCNLLVGDVVAFRDARESKRRMCIKQVSEDGCWASLKKTTYVVPGVTLNLKKRNGRKKSVRVLDVSRKPAQSIKLEAGDTLLLTRDTQSGHCAVLDESGQITVPATIGCTLPSVFDDVKAGEPIWFDDGRIGGVIESVEPDALHVVINHPPGGAKLKSDKGINLPNSDLKLESLSASDIEALEFACKHADGVQLSFVNCAADIESLAEQLTRLDARNMAVVLKIETRQGFDNLAQLLIAGMQLPRLGVMIARGDLAIETGFERTAELQEELLCICEAAHVPVIWATQVLETLAKTGSPTRAEMTDAATSARAECVMLNKGPHILEAIRCLDDVLGRMQTHQRKKVDLMRKLSVARIRPTDHTE